MCKYKKLLIALDGSESSSHALEEGVKFAKETQAELVAISVIPPHRELVSAFSIFGHIKELVRKPFIKALEEAKDLAEDEGVSIKTFLEDGVPCDKIIEIALKENCDLIITGRRGATNFDKILIGSTAAKLLNESPIDMLIVPRNTRINFKKILTATDLSEHGNNAVKKSAKLAKTYNGELAIISVIQLPPELAIGEEEIMEMLKSEVEKQLIPIKEEIDKLGVKSELFIEKGDPHVIIVDKIKEIGISLVAIGANKETGKKIIGSVAQKIIANSPVPILIAKN
jgi:nucleotide-binding universal stress UspA family protein